MRPIVVGTFRKRITLQALTGSTRDSYGQITQTWGDVATYWAALTPLKMKNITVAGKVESLVSHTLVMRHPGSVPSPANNRYRLGTRLFAIVGFLDVEERGRELQVSVTEIEA